MTSSTPRQSLAQRLFISSRPVSWVNTAYPFAAAWLIAAGVPTGADLVLLIVGTLFFLVPYNLAMYGINDVYDYESDARNPRKGGAEGALLPPETHRAVFSWILMLTVPFVVAFALLASVPTLLVLTVSLFFVIAYSAPPFRWKEVPFLDSFTSAMHFVTPAVVGLVASGSAWNTTAVLALLAFTAWAMASHAFGAVQDIQPDREAGLASIGTVLGAAPTVRLSIALWGAALVLALFLGWPGILTAVIPALYIANAAPFWKVTDATAGDTNRGWRRFLWLNYASGFLLTMVFILHVTAG